MKLLTCLFVISVFVLSCGQQEFTSLTRLDSSGDATQEHGDDIIVPPGEYYEPTLEEELDESVPETNDDDIIPENTQVLFVKMDGERVVKGYDRGESFIPCRANSIIADPNLSLQKQNEIIQLVQAYYDKAEAKIYVTPNKPSSGDYTTIIVGGSYSDLGCAGGGVLGIAPYDRQNINKNDIGFAFLIAGDSSRVIADTVAHEAGHSFGLDHINNQQALMNPSLSQVVIGFLSGRISGGFGTQDSAALLRENLGVRLLMNLGYYQLAPVEAAQIQEEVAEEHQILSGLIDNLENLESLTDAFNIEAIKDFPELLLKLKKYKNVLRNNFSPIEKKVVFQIMRESFRSKFKSLLASQKQ